MSSRETVAAIDVGSNSIKLLVAKAGNGPQIVETVFVETIETRISAGISCELPSLSDEAMQAGTATISELVRLARLYQPSDIQIVATSAVRDALNGQDFIDAVKEATTLEIRILSGTQEATYIGKGLACDPEIKGVKRFIQMDIGGGSLELVRFDHGHIEQAISLQLGAVRLTERFIEDRDIPVSPDVETAIQSHVKDCLTKSGFNFSPSECPLIVTGGAFSVTRAVLAAKAGTTIDHFRAQLSANEISDLKARLSALPLHERMAVPHLPAARADIVPTALITIETVLRHAQRSELTHSFYNLRYGIVAEMLVI
ncbi:MAG: phosphatase [Opitutales bacterium]|nr:phosphatase [Opitutales bacterium]MDP4644051.1 phosphatase [Opitutales bacterium]MDP4879108.1 phosphatase [Opitutales bacterium]